MRTLVRIRHREAVVSRSDCNSSGGLVEAEALTRAPCYVAGFWLTLLLEFFQMIAGPLLSAVHIYGVTQEMRATPVNTLNPQRTAMIVADFLKVRNSSTPSHFRAL